MRTPTRADGTPIMIPEEITGSMQTPPPVSEHSPSMTFIVVISIIFGLIIGLGTIVGVLGGAFFVKRDEYTEKNLRSTEEITTLHNALNRVENTLSRQEAAFDKLSDAVQSIKLSNAVQSIKVDMVRRR